jgi:hypothetical protein
MRKGEVKRGQTPLPRLVGVADQIVRRAGKSQSCTSGLAVVGDLSHVMKRKPRRQIASKSRIARPFGPAAKLNDSFPSSAACAVHTAYTPPP